MLCYDQSVPDFGLMQSVPDFGPMQSVPNFGPMQSVPDSGPMQLVPDFGPMQGTRSRSVPDFGPMQLVPDFGLMQWARPSMCFICIVWYVVVWGSSLSFGLFQVLPQVKGRARDDGIAHTTASVFILGVDSVFLNMF